jgi:hypothetical protein
MRLISAGSTRGEHHFIEHLKNRPWPVFCCERESLVPGRLGIQLLGSHDPGRTEFDRVFQRAAALSGVVDATVMNQPGLLQMLEGVGNGVLPSVVVQNFFAQACRVGMQQSGQDFLLQCVIDGHVYLALLV